MIKVDRKYVFIYRVYKGNLICNISSNLIIVVTLYLIFFFGSGVCEFIVPTVSRGPGSAARLPQGGGRNCARLASQVNTHIEFPAFLTLPLFGLYSVLYLKR